MELRAGPRALLLRFRFLELRQLVPSLGDLVTAAHGVVGLHQEFEDSLEAQLGGAKNQASEFTARLSMVRERFSAPRLVGFGDFWPSWPSRPAASSRSSSISRRSGVSVRFAGSFRS